jgi:predicted ATPase/DNA-binding SARP family transcriptional activator
MGGATFRILGPLEADVDGNPVELSAAQLRRLLLVLLLAPGRPVHVDTVAECMWPDDGALASRPENTGKTLQIYVSRLRKILPDQVGPHFEARGYRLGAGVDDVDASLFETLLATARHPADDAEQTAAVLRSALALWRGPAISDCRDEPWAIGAAARLDELRLSAEERLTDARLALGDHAGLCAEVEQSVEENPLRERLWYQLMLALYRSGRQADALRAYQRVRGILGEELGLEPGRELADLETAILRHDPALDAPPPGGLGTTVGSTAGDDERGSPDGLIDSGETRHVPSGRRSVGLPVRATSFIGRQREIEEVEALVGSSRLVTLTGPAGVGKTRLGLEIADRLAASPVGDPVVFVDLAPLRGRSELLSAVAGALAIRVGRDAPAPDTIVKAVGDENLHLLIDNCEHLAADCAELSSALLSSCRGIVIIATSTRPLGTSGESIYVVPSLDVPGPDELDSSSIEVCDGVRLFVERARAARPEFGLDAANSVHVATICQRLDGVPLALELAAARVRVLAPAEISAGLDERFRILSVASGAVALPRHRTLRALIDWSYNLLEPAERSLLRQLSVFSGGFDLDGAAAVLAGDGSDRWAVLEGITSLVDMSLVLADPRGDTTRYRLLESIRQYAFDRLLEEDGWEAAAALRTAHADAYLSLAQALRPVIGMAHPIESMDRLELDFPNLRLAIDAALETKASTRRLMEVFSGLGRFSSWHGHVREWQAFGDALAGRPELDEQSELAFRTGLLRVQLLGLSDPLAATTMLEELVRRARAAGDLGTLAKAFNRLAWFARATGDSARSASLRAESVELARKSEEYDPLMMILSEGGNLAETEEALDLARAVNDQIAEHTALGNLANLALVNGEWTKARQYAESAVSILGLGRVPGAWTGAVLNLGLALVQEGSIDRARAVYRRAVEMARRQSDERELGYALIGVGLCAAGDGDLIGAATHYGAARQRFEPKGFAISPAEEAALSTSESSVRSQIGADAFDAAVRRGRALSKDEAADLGLGQLGATAPAGVPGRPDRAG